jgi:hypothetical protein
MSDPALIGAWRGKMENGGPVYMHVLPGKEDGMTVLLVSGEDKADGADWSAFQIVTAEVEGTHYLSALWQLNGGKPVEGRDKGYHLMRYEIGADGALRLYGIDEDKLMQAVQAGTVEGRIEGEGGAAEVRLTASSEKLVKFLKHAKPQALFDKPFSTLAKLAAP